MTNLFYNLLICLSFASFGFAFRSYLRKGTKDSEKVMDDFLRAEHEASFITKKDFPSQLLIKLDTMKIPSVENETCKLLHKRLICFADAPMVSLEGYTNLELKKNFGINHFTSLIRYEETLNAFIRQAYGYALALVEYGYPKEAIGILEYLIENQWATEKMKGTYRELTGGTTHLPT